MELQFFAIGLVLVTSAADAVRDAKHGSKDFTWMQWHVVKWIAFYGPLAFITYIHIDWEYWLPLTIASWITWRLSVRFLGGKQWESHWKKYLGL